MKRSHRIAAAVLFVGVGLALTPPASAKELAALEVCGAAGCKRITHHPVLRELIHAIEAQAHPVTVRTPAPAPFLRLEYYIRGHGHGRPDFTQYYAPAARRLAIETDPDAWAWVDARPIRRLLERITAGWRPFAKPTVTRVLVGGEPVRDPASYLRLFSLRTAANDYSAGDWMTIRIETAEPSPWSTRAATLEYSPAKNVLWRGTEFLKLPSTTAAALERRTSLAGASPVGSFPLAAVAGAMGAAALAVPAAWLVRRRRRH